MTLNTKKAAVARADAYDETALDNVIDSVLTKVRELGVEAPTYNEDEPPDDLAQMGADIDTLSDRDLGNFHVKLVSYLSFLTYRTMLQKVRYEASSQFYKNFRDRLQLDLATKSVPKSQWSTVIAGNEVFSKIEIRMYHEKYVYEVLKSRQDGVEAQANAVSRLITARGQESNALGRSNASGLRGGPLRFPDISPKRR